MKGVTRYSDFSQWYFRHLLKQIIEVGNLEKTELKILDFGCGQSELKKLIHKSKVIGYDIIPELTDVRDWREVDFDILVSLHVFYSFSETELESLLIELKQKNPQLQFVVGISTQGWLNNIGKFLLGHADAHSKSRLDPFKEIKIFEKHCKVLQKKRVLSLATILRMEFQK